MKGYIRTMDPEACRNLCDSCYETDLGVMHYHQGEAIIFECRRCNPEGFEKAARRDIDRWLDGGCSQVNP